ncbi:MAG: ammonium transporter [Cyanobacteria bacterium HKST-UBA03]|nr:ammonium transporter [Cyanobacteria bacterium HKST-UBA03]
MNTGDISWILCSSSLVMLMTPAVGLFYGGMVRKKNLLSTIMLSFTALVVITVQWVLFGYSLAFGPDVGHLIGDLSWFGLRGVGVAPNTDYAATIPHLGYMLFQMKFAIITPALITGAFVERVRFSTYVLFILLWATLIYDPMAHWVWGMGGWLRNLGALDFAGGTVIHITSGVAALCAALLLPQRRGFGKRPEDPNSITLTLLGAILLWFGWFGFNGGSAYAADGLAIQAIVNTNAAAAAAAITWMLLSGFNHRASVMGVATGAVVGLVAITPACGYVEVVPAMIIGTVGAVISYYCIQFRHKLKVDDSLDVWACHGMSGTWGALATGLFATTTINPAGANGLFYGNPGLLWIQFVSVVVAWVWAFGMTALICKGLNAFSRMTVSAHEELVGLDLSQHGEEAAGSI